MALSPTIYKQARDEAQLHVQVELLEKPQYLDGDNENFSLLGKIIRIFRGSQYCHVGQVVNFNAAVKASSDCYCSGVLWLNHQDFLQNDFMEVFLNGQPPECAVALYQYELIAAPTEHSTISSSPRNF